VRSFTDLDTAPHDGHVAPPAWAVTTCTIRVPSAKRSTRSTRTPANPNKFVVASDTPLGPSSSPERFATFRLRKTKGPSRTDTPTVGYITLARSKSKSLYALAMTLPEASDFLGGRCATVAGLGQLTLLVGLPPGRGSGGRPLGRPHRANGGRSCTGRKDKPRSSARDARWATLTAGASGVGRVVVADAR
jgi:hypothetical protein